MWQQDRWSNGGAHGLGTAVSTDAGATWTDVTPPKFSRCAGGTAANGGDCERSSDPRVSFAPNGDAYPISLSVNLFTNFATAVLVSKSTDGGATWESPRISYNPGANNSTLGHQIVVRPDGMLVDVFTEFLGFKNSDKGLVGG